MKRIARALLLLCLMASAHAAASSLNIEDPERLQAIERAGFTFGEVVLGPASAGADNAALYRRQSCCRPRAAQDR
jgi:hypothetical protein